MKHTINILKSLLAILLLGNVATTTAQTANRLYFQDQKAIKGKTIQVPLYLDNTSVDIVAMQFDVVATSSISMQSDPVLSETRQADHVLTSVSKGSSNNANRHTIMVYSPTNTPIKGSAGEVLSFSFWLPESLNDGASLPIAIENAILSDRQGHNILTGTANAAITITPTPDFEVSDLTLSSHALNPGDAVSISWTVANVGNAASEGGWSERLLLQSRTGEQISLGTFHHDQTLAAGATEQRQFDITLPQLLGIDGQVNAKVELVPNADAGESSALLKNNTTQTSGYGITVYKRLYLTLPQTAIEEANRTIRGQLARSGNWKTATAFTLTKKQGDDRLEVPSQVTIQNGQSTAYFDLTLHDNDILDADSVFVITATGGTYSEVEGTLIIANDEHPALTLRSSKSEITEGDTFELTITLPSPAQQPVTVSLGCEQPKRFSFPTQVTIPQGQTTAVVEVVAIDNDIIEQQEGIAFIAASEQYDRAECVIILNDNDMPSIEMELTPTTVNESAGPMAIVAKIRRTNNFDKKVTLALSDNSDGDIYYPTRSVIMEKGVKEAQFSLGIVDNSVVDGDRDVTINATVYMASCSCKATGSETGDVSCVVHIIDDDGNALSLTSTKGVILEGDAEGAQLTITRNTSTETALTVHLSTNHDDCLNYERDVVIPIGASSTTVTLTALSNAFNGDDKEVIITAEADDFAKGICWILISDQTLPDAVIADFTISANEVTIDNVVDIEVTVANQGAYRMEDAVPVYVYLSGTDTPVAKLYTPNALEKGESVKLTSYILAPKTVGDFILTARVNVGQKVKELTGANNVSKGIPFKIQPPFHATITTDKDVYRTGETVKFSGAVEGSPSANDSVEIYIINNGMRETLYAKLSAGKFNINWTPVANQAGDFAIGACYPGELLDEQMASFKMYGLKLDRSTHTKIDIFTEQTFQGTLHITNPGSLPLTNIKAKIVQLPDGCELKIEDIKELEGYETKEMAYSIKGKTPTKGNDWALVKMEILCDEGVSEDKTLYYYCRPSKANLKASIATINTTISKGNVREYQFTISNNGQGNTGAITLSLPAFIKSETPTNLPPLDFGESTTVGLRLTQTSDMQINVPITGQLAINCENGDGIVIPYSATLVSEDRGRLIIDVTDEYSFYTDEKPHLSGAEITVTHPTTGALIAQGTSGDDGTWTTELPEGYYSVSISAPKHNGYRNNILVNPGRDNKVNVFLAFNAIEYSWNVVETEIEDVYDIVTTVKYETRVPKPVVVVDFPKLPYRNHIAYVSVTNKGLLSAHNVIITPPANNEYMQFELLEDNHIAELKAGQNVVIPIRVYVDEDDAYPAPTMTVGSYSFNGQVYGETMSTRHRHMRTPLNRPTCLQGDMQAEVDDEECDPDTGQPVKVGTKTVDSHYYYGDCGPHGWGGGGIGGSVGGGGGGLSGGGGVGSPGGSSNSSNYSTYAADRLRTILNTGCLTNCEKALADAIKACYDAIGACTGGEGIDIINWIQCAKNVYDNCRPSNITSFSNSLGCGSSVAGCIPGLDCPAALFDCLKAAYEAFRECMKAQQKDKARGKVEAEKAKEMSIDNNEGFELFIDYNRATLEWIRLMLGDGDWSELTGNDISRMFAYALNHRGDDSYIPMSADRYEAKPEAVSKEQFDRFIERCNNTWNFEKTGEASDNMANWSQLSTIFAKKDSIEQASQKLGYNDYYDMADYAIDYFKALLEKAKETTTGVCSTITLEINQQLVMTRQAFRGSLTIFNGNEVNAMTDVKLSLDIKDEDGNIATAREFQINAENLNGFVGALDLGSGWTLDAQQTGKVDILFIPTKYAAPAKPVLYSFGGSISYVDPFTSLEVTRDLLPVTLTVNPSPELDLIYFMQRDILGDDPFTETIEPSQSAEFALIINNKGFGDANNVRMTTQQPQIIENEKGLLVNFEIVSSQVNGQPASLSFGQTISNDFGTIPGQSQAYAQWWLQSSLLGHFTDYDVKATHVTSYGNENLSLLSDVSIHELVRGFTLITNDDKKLRGFLVNDVADTDDLPDEVYFSDATQLPVEIAIRANINKVEAIQYELEVMPSLSGWTYASVADPTGGRQKLVSIVRKSDGKELPIDNVWQTDRTLRDGTDPLYENRLHFIGDVATGGDTYVLTFEESPEVVLAVEAIEGVPEEGTVLDRPLETITVRFNKPIDAETFTTDDLSLTCQGVHQDVSQIGIEQLTGTDYSLDLKALTQQNGYFVLVVQTAGITDTEGFQGANGGQASWTQYSPELSIRPISIDSNELQVVVTPIPLRDAMYVDGNFTQLQRVTISDTKGIVKLRVDNALKGHPIDVSSLQSGVYVISISTEKGVLRQKLLKQ